MAETDLEKDLAIDPNNLDKAWMNQSRKYWKWADILLEAGTHRDDMKFKLDYVKAELDLDIRKDPDKYDIPKITESIVSSAILVADKYCEALKKYNEAKSLYAKAEQAVNSITINKYALENMVKLWQGEYYSVPKEQPNESNGKMDIKQMREKKVEQNVAAQRDNLKKRRRKVIKE